MKINQEFTVSKPLPVVWDFFRDVPRVAHCMPGAQYESQRDDGKHLGKMSARLGPFQANFEGEAEVRYDDTAKQVAVQGKGVDKKGASRGKMTMNCVLESVESGTKVVVDADVQLSGTLAQFGRTGLITEVANAIVADFVRNAEAELATKEDDVSSENVASTLDQRSTPAAQPISGLPLLFQALKSWLRNLFSGGQ